MSITVRDVTKRFGEFVALDHVSLEVPGSGLVALLGPSGSGKTTLLRVIAGLEVPDEGSVLYGEDDVTDMPARQRNLGFVFQHYALFRHMSVFENVAFALRIRSWPEERVRERVNELLHLVRLEGFGARQPSELSGGQRQRVALARALAAQPKVLLLDEPFGALDAQVRQELRQWLRRLHHSVGVATILVTHDQEEAFEVADRVVLLNRGRVEQAGAPLEVFENPASSFVMDFLGRVNVFHGRVEGGRAFLGELEVPCPDYLHEEPRSAAVYVRPHELDIDVEPNGCSSLPARVLHINPAGPVARVHLAALEGNLALQVEVTPERWQGLGLKVGDTAYVSPRRARVFLPDYAI
jgi:sulfate/thiosulfate transport system ATP-binding protein